MRQAQVTDISGRHVCVSGRWVTCIGNRTPSVGDLVWTDGRCVYGNEQEGGGSSVVAGGGSKGIPILIYHRAYLMEREKSRRVGTLKDVEYIVHRKNHIAYFAWEDRIADADIDSHGNLYEVIGASGIEWFPKESDATTPRNFTIAVKKNKDVLEQINFSAYYEQAKEDCLALRDELPPVEEPFPSLYGIFDCKQGYVDADGHWGAWLFIGASGTLELAGDSAGVLQLYYFDESGAHLLMDTRGRLTNEAPCIVKTNEYYAGVSGRRFPIHDGYYFTMEPYQPVWWRIGLPTVVVATIYTPQGEALLTGRFYNIPRFSILPTGAGRYLLDVNHRIVPAFEMTSGALFDVTKREDMTHIAPGIYLLENGSLTQLIDGYNDALRLRYLKDSKKWVRSIQGNRKD
ncbi:MAG: hypothetical protein SPL39_07605 [Selenomonadaceae bacterium]|nr:hypothetical protein [Selenomonadaceae bacterium]